MKKLLVFGLLILATNYSIAQSTIDRTMSLEGYETELAELGKDILSRKPTKEREESNAEFRDLLKEALENPDSYEYPFDSIKTASFLMAPDESFRIITWLFPKGNGGHYYYGFIQQYDKKTKSTIVRELIDESDSIKAPLYTPVGPAKWYGALYYKIVQEKHKGIKYYTLLGWDGNNISTTKKIIDVLTFEEGFVTFGAPIFDVNRKEQYRPQRIQHRVIFEYSSQVSMKLNYFENDDWIVFDHIVPSDASYEGKYEYYGPDFSFDAFEFKKGKWVLVENVEYDYNLPKPVKRDIKIDKGLSPKDK